MSVFEASKEWLNTLSEEQARAAFCFDHPAMTLAGPGAGKTRTLIARMIKLLLPESEGGRGVEPGSVMATTFTNKAAGELRERARPILDALRERGIEGSPWIGTTHSLALRILRIESDHANLGYNFTILDESDSEAMITEVVEGMQIETFDLDKFKSDLEKAKSQVLSPQVLITQREMLSAIPGDIPLNRFQREWSDRLQGFKSDNFIEIYSAYQDELARQNSVDFSDIINLVTKMLRENTAVRDSWRSTFRDFLFDEVQDFSEAQKAFLLEITNAYRPDQYAPDANWSTHGSALGGNHAVNRSRAHRPRTGYFIGDPDQSIYGFRLAFGYKTVKSLISSIESMPEKPFFIQHSHRSPEPVLRFCDTLIRHNVGRFDKDIKAAKKDPKAAPVNIFAYETWQDEVQGLVDEVNEYVNMGGNPSDYGVLLRSRNAARAVARQLRGSLIPVNEGKASDIQKSTEIKNVMAYCNAIVNDYSENALRRIINVPARNMGKTSVTKLVENAKKGGRDFRAELRHVMNMNPDDKDAREGYTKQFVNAAKNFGRMFVDMRKEALQATNAAEAILIILRKSGYYGELCDQAMLGLKGVEPESERGMALKALEPRQFLAEVMRINAAGGKDANRDFESEDLEELADMTGRLSEAFRRIGNISILIEQASRFGALIDFVQESTLEMSSQEETPGVRVMTVHASKGLEMPHVRLLFWGDKIFPSGADMTPAEEAEERNIAMVAASRTEKTLVISYPKSIGVSPFYHGKPMNNVNPSRFIMEGMLPPDPAARTTCDYAAIYMARDGRRVGPGRAGPYQLERKAPVPEIQHKAEAEKKEEFAHEPGI